MMSKLALYVTAHTVREMLQKRELAQKLTEKCKAFGIEKLYIENYRDGLTLTSEEVSKVAKLFNSMEVAGGTAIGTWGEGWGRSTSFGFRVTCLTDQLNRNLISKAMSELARAFNEIIIDDFWANWCYCDQCIQEFNSRYGFSLTRERIMASRYEDKTVRAYWTQFAADLLKEVSKDYVVGPARRENPKVKITLKVAEWREDFRWRGLYLDNLKDLFDNSYVGTESREGTWRYGSFYIIEYMKALVGEKLRGAWFDTYNGFGFDLPVTIGVQAFLEQARFSFLGGLEEVTLFEARAFLDPFRERHFSRLSSESGDLTRISSLVRDSHTLGLKTLAIQHVNPSNADRYIQDVLGSIGVPLKPVRVETLKEGDRVLITESDLDHVELSWLIKEGVNPILTGAAAESVASGVQGEEGMRLIGLDPRDPIESKARDVIGFGREGEGPVVEGHRRETIMPVGPILRLSEGRVILYSTDGKSRFPAVFQRGVGRSEVTVLAVTKYPVYLKERYPEVVRRVVREVTSEDLGIRLESRGPILNTSMTLHRGGDSIYVGLVNMNQFDSIVNLVVEGERFKVNSLSLKAGKAELRGEREVEGGKSFTVYLPNDSSSLLELK
jgi:hypothetical protein